MTFLWLSCTDSANAPEPKSKMHGRVTKSFVVHSYCRIFFTYCTCLLVCTWAVSEGEREGERERETTKRVKWEGERDCLRFFKREIKSEKERVRVRKRGQRWRRQIAVVRLKRERKMKGKILSDETEQTFWRKRNFLLWPPGLIFGDDDDDNNNDDGDGDNNNHDDDDDVSDQQQSLFLILFHCRFLPPGVFLQLNKTKAVPFSRHVEQLSGGASVAERYTALQIEFLNDSKDPGINHPAGASLSATHYSWLDFGSSSQENVVGYTS